MEGQSPPAPPRATPSAVAVATCRQHLATNTATAPQREIIEQRCHDSVGEWRPEQRLVHMRQQRGSRWGVHGHTHGGGSTVLAPEEALFLRECGALQILHEEKPMSLQECFHSLLAGEGLLFYQVYALLKRIGFIASRVCLYRRFPSTSGHLLSGDGSHGDGSHGDTGPLGAELGVAMKAELQEAKGPEEPKAAGERVPSEGEGTQDASEGGGELYMRPSCPLCAGTAGSEDQRDRKERFQMLEVHKPKKGTPFKKSQPGPPDLRVIIARPSEEFPTARRVKELCRIQPQCPLMVCVVEGADFAFYRLSTPS